MSRRPGRAPPGRAWRPAGPTSGRRRRRSAPARAPRSASAASSSASTARSCPIAAEAATPCPTTSPTTSATLPSASGIASNQSPPAACSCPATRYRAAIVARGSTGRAVGSRASCISATILRTPPPTSSPPGHLPRCAAPNGSRLAAIPAAGSRRAGESGFQDVRNRACGAEGRRYEDSRGKGTVVSASDKAKNKAQETKGKAKETAGKAVGNERLEAEGVADQARPTSSRPARRSRTQARA